MLLSCVTLLAQDALSRFASRAESSRVGFDYVFSVKGNLPLKGEGKALVQGDSFFVSGNGLEIRCDGTTRWTADTDSKEVVIEGVEEGIADLAANPALLIVSFDEAFDRVAVKDDVFGGRKVKAFSLKPKIYGGFESAVLYFSGDELAGASVTSSDGTVTDFTISSLTFSYPEKTEEFSFDVSSFDKSWVVTDLR